MQPALAFLQTGATLPNELMDAVNHDWIRVALNNCTQRLVGEGKATSFAKSCVVVMIPDERQLYDPLSLEFLFFANAEEFSQIISQ